MAAIIVTLALAPMVLSPGVVNPSASPPSLLHDYTVISENGTYAVKSISGEMVHAGLDANNAIDAALRSLSPERTTKEKVLLRGDFTVSRAIEVPSHTSLQLDGKVTMGPLSKAHLVTATNATDFELVGGEWDGNQAGQIFGGPDRDCFSFLRCHQATIANLTVHDSPYTNINVVNSDLVNISGVHSYSSGNYYRGQAHLGHGIMMYACSYSIVQNCNIHDTSKGGIYFYTEDDGISETQSNNLVQNNLVERTWTSGIELGGRGTNDVCTSGVVRGNTVIDGGMDGEHMGIAIGWWGPLSGAVRYADHFTVTGNTVYQTKSGAGGGIGLMAHDSVCSNNVVHDVATAAVGCRGDRNTISGNDVDRAAIGIQFWDGNHNEVISNTITGCGTGVALYKGLTSGCSYNHISSNHFQDTKDEVLAIHDQGSIGNTFEGNELSGGNVILDNGTDTVIRNNIIE